MCGIKRRTLRWVKPVGLLGGSSELSGSLGQTAASQASGGTPLTETESGYFSKMVVNPSTPAFQKVFSDSMTFAWGSGANPQGTFYDVELSTDSAFPPPLTSAIFTGGNAATFTSLLSDATYFARIRSGYMEGDETDW